MKKYLKIFASITATAFIITGCSTYAQTGTGYYDSNYGYYGDGQTGDYYGYDQQQPVDYNNQGVPANQPPVGFNDFYNQLSPYGVWINMPPYGQVWVANVPNFQPYSTNGYWAYTTYGWTWVSNYPWGWAPFHYGRWGYTNRYGWYWVPGYVWGPAWVAWSSSTDMYGWAPLMPGMHFGVSISINLFPSSYWTFMPGRYMGYNNIGNYYVNRSRNVTIIKNTTIINNYGTENNRRYSMGPNANDVQRYTGRSVQPLRVSNASDSRSVGVSKDEMRVYRPVSRSERTTTGSDNNRTTTPQTRRQQSEQSGTNTTAPQTRRQQEQPGANTTAPQTRRQQPEQQGTNTTAPQTRRQQPEQSATRTVTPQTRNQPNQQASRQPSTTREYRQNPAQPAVTKNVAPQTTKQIQTAEKDRNQQRSSATQSRRR